MRVSPLHEMVLKINFDESRQERLCAHILKRRQAIQKYIELYPGSTNSYVMRAMILDSARASQEVELAARKNWRRVEADGRLLIQEIEVLIQLIQDNTNREWNNENQGDGAV